MYSNNQFENLIYTGKKIEIVSILKDKNICMYIIENNLFWNNLDLILKKFDQNIILTYINYLSSYSPNFLSYELIEFFKYNFRNEFFIDLFKNIEKSNLNSKAIYEYIIKNKILTITPYVLFSSMYDKGYTSLLYDNLDTILENSYDLLHLKEIVKDDSKFIERINKFIENNPNRIVYEIIMKKIGKTKQEIDNERIFDFVKIIIDEVLENENIKYSDIEIIGQGAESIVYSLGDKVLKLGKEREPFIINNNKRFLKPILRTNISSLITDQILFCIEVTEKVDTNNITIEDTYEIYKELREQGLVWFDCRPQNLGKLKRKNSIYMKEEINPVNYSIGYNTDNNEELEKDELIIIDNAFIYDEEFFIEYIGFNKEGNRLIYEFEERYKNENKKTY